jgi:hypothetical protein
MMMLLLWGMLSKWCILGKCVRLKSISKGRTRYCRI